MAARGYFAADGALVAAGLSPFGKSVTNVIVARPPGGSTTTLPSGVSVIELPGAVCVGRWLMTRTASTIAMASATKIPAMLSLRFIPTDRHHRFRFCMFDGGQRLTLSGDERGTDVE